MDLSAYHTEASESRIIRRTPNTPQSSLLKNVFRLSMHHFNFVKDTVVH